MVRTPAPARNGYPEAMDERQPRPNDPTRQEPDAAAGPGGTTAATTARRATAATVPPARGGAPDRAVGRPGADLPGDGRSDEVLPLGKLAPDLLAGLIGGALPPEVVIGPRVGEDACAIEVEAGVLVAATDPITLTGAQVGAHAAFVNANDVAVTGVRPRWFLACVLLPEGAGRGETAALFAGMRRALEQVGAVLVGGHTEVTAAVRQPVVAGQMLGTTAGRPVPTGGLRPGDVVVQIGPAPVEGAAVLADLLPTERLAPVAAPVLEAARGALETPGISVVEPALAAARAGAVALHDPTEGGLAAGLHEMAQASGVALTIDPDRVAWFGPGVSLCRAAGIDPWGTLASGALLAGFRADGSDDAQRELARGGMGGPVIGYAREGHGVTLVNGAPVPRFERDELSRLQSGPGIASRHPLGPPIPPLPAPQASTIRR